MSALLPRRVGWRVGVTRGSWEQAPLHASFGGSGGLAAGGLDVESSSNGRQRGGPLEASRLHHAHHHHFILPNMAAANVDAIVIIDLIDACTAVCAGLRIPVSCRPLAIRRPWVGPWHLCAARAAELRGSGQAPAERRGRGTCRVQCLSPGRPQGLDAGTSPSRPSIHPSI